MFCHSYLLQPGIYQAVAALRTCSYAGRTRFDVWLANARGNRYSLEGQVIPTKSPKDFWYFSFEEQGCYDVPNVIDYILERSSYRDLTYIGHSQGSLQFFVGM